MTIAAVKVKAMRCTCGRCGKSWIARFNRIPLKCIGCKSPYWNRDRVRGIAKKGRPKIALEKMADRRHS